MKAPNHRQLPLFSAGRTIQLNQKRKREMLRRVQPFLQMAFGAFSVLSGDRFKEHRLHRLPSNGLRILVVRLDTIGDVLLSEPALRAIRARFPKSRIELVTSPAGAAVLAGNPAIDEIIPYKAPWHAAWRGQRLSWRDALGLLHIVRELRGRHYDLGFELRSDFRDIAFLAATGTGVKIGDSWRGGDWLLDIDAGAPVDAHRVEFALAIAGATGADVTPSAPVIHLSANDEAAARDALAPLGGRPFVAFHLGAGFASKCLPVDRFAAVARRLARDYGIVVVGSDDERALVDSFVAAFRAPVLDLAGTLSLKETAAVLKHAQLFIGNDSGPMHLAAAAGRPIVTFFGPSEPHKYRPYGVPQRVLEIDLICRPCDHVHCVHAEYLCMTRIPVTEIIRAAEDLLPEPAKQKT